MPNNKPDYKYSKDHEWVSVEGNVATIGITPYAVEHLGDMVFVDLNEVGSSVKQHESAGTLESVKAAADLYTPIGGEVVERNDAVIDDPSLLNADAFGTWLLRLTPSDLGELDGLMTGAEYDEYEASQ